MSIPFTNPTARAVRRLLVLAVCLVLSLPAAAQQTSADASPTADPRAALVEILRDEASREALIAELERGAEDAAASAEPAAPPVSLPRRIAAASQAAVQSVAENAVAAWSALQRAPDALDNFGAREVAIVMDAVRDLLLVIGSTVVAFVALRLVGRVLFRRMGEHAQRSPLPARTLIVAAAAVLDAVLVVLAWGIGYALAATVIGQFGEVAIRQSLYLNAFLVVEMAKVVMRLVIAPSSRGLRPLPISDLGARRLYRALNIGISIAGYGLLLIVPIVTANASVAAGNSVASVVVLLAALYLAAACLRRKTPVAEWLLAQARVPVTAPGGSAPATEPGIAPEPGAPDDKTGPAASSAAADDDGTGMAPEPAPAKDARIVVEGAGATRRVMRQPRRHSLYAALARKWHVVALLWLALVLGVALTQPVSGVFDVLRASALIGVAVVAAVALSGVLSRAIGTGVRLPPDWTRSLPRLETRLNGFVPQILAALRAALLIALALFVVDVAGLFDVGRWLGTPAGLALLGTVLSVLAIIGFGFAIWLALTSWVEYRLNPDVGAVPTAREQTLLTLLRNALTIVLLVITLMFALSEIGLDIGPLLASAGVLGLAIGFGAQKLVQDVITGIFIQFENAMNVGDVVTAGAVSGVVEKLTIRSVSLRDLHGVYHLVPFSSVDAVSNFTRDFSNYVIDMGIAYREDVEEARQAMFDAYDALRADPDQAPHLLGDLEWFGLDQFGDSAVVLRARIRTKPGKQWGVGRAYNAIVKRIFDARGIEIPFPHTTLYFGENKKGDTQSLRVESADTPQHD